MISTSSEAGTQEVLGTRAYVAANSAIQSNFSNIYFVNTNFEYEYSEQNFEIELNTGLSANICGKIESLSVNGRMGTYN